MGTLKEEYKELGITTWAVGLHMQTSCEEQPGLPGVLVLLNLKYCCISRSADNVGQA